VTSVRGFDLEDDRRDDLADGGLGGHDSSLETRQGRPAGRPWNLRNPGP
jgi:hypothetical protein